MTALWKYSDQQDIKPISKNNEQRFNQLAIETQVKELPTLLGEKFYQDLIQNPDTPEHVKLLDGGTYVLDGFTYEFAGLKYVLSYFLYSKYILENEIADTFGGMVRKNFEDSQPISQGQKKNLMREMDVIGNSYFAECAQFLNANSSDYPHWNCATRKKKFYF
jgi:hypothetical protein